MPEYVKADKYKEELIALKLKYQAEADEAQNRIDHYMRMYMDYMEVIVDANSIKREALKKIHRLDEKMACNDEDDDE